MEDVPGYAPAMCRGVFFRVKSTPYFSKIPLSIIAERVKQTVACTFPGVVYFIWPYFLFSKKRSYRDMQKKKRECLQGSATFGSSLVLMLMGLLSVQVALGQAADTVVHPPFGAWKPAEKPTWMWGLKGRMGFLEYWDQTATQRSYRIVTHLTPTVGYFVNRSWAVGASGEFLGLNMGNDTLVTVGTGQSVLVFVKKIFWQEGTSVAKRPYTFNFYGEVDFGLTSYRFDDNPDAPQLWALEHPFAACSGGLNVQILPRVYLVGELRLLAAFKYSGTPGTQVALNAHRYGLEFIW